MHGILNQCLKCEWSLTCLLCFASQLCPACAQLNWNKRVATADLKGYIALVTGGRVKIGYSHTLAPAHLCRHRHTHPFTDSNPSRPHVRRVWRASGLRLPSYCSVLALR